MFLLQKWNAESTDNFCKRFESSPYATGRNGAAKLHRAAGRFETNI